MAIRALIFDFGNVVCFFDHRLTTDRLTAYSPLPAEEIHRALFGSELEYDYDTGRLTTAQFIERACEVCRLDCPEEHFRRAWEDIFWPNDEVVSLLPRLKRRYRLLLGSNTNEMHTTHFCRQFADAFRHFDHLVFSHQVGARKPEKAFFEHCVRLAGSHGEECVFIDDLPANVAGAEACGLKAILFHNVADLRERLARLGVVTTTD